VCVYRCGHFPETAGLPANASHDLVAESTCTGCCCQSSQWRRQTQETQCCDESYFNNTFCNRTFNSCQWVNIKTHGRSTTYHTTGTPKHVSTLFAVVAGIVVGGVSSTVHGTKRRHGERDKDRSKGAKRKFRRCVGNSRSDKEAQECNGAWVRGCDLGYSCVTRGVLWSCDCFQKIQT